MKRLIQHGLVGLLLAGYVTPSVAQSKWSVSLSVAPVYSNGFSQADNIFGIGASPQLFFRSAGHGWGYSVGVLSRYNFSPKWSASVGLWATNWLTSYADITANGQSFVMDRTNSRPFNLWYKVPLMVNYQLSTGRLSPYFSAGVSFDFRGKSYVELGNGQEAEVRYGEPLIVTPLLGAGVIYRLNDRFSLSVQPTLQYDIHPRPDYDQYRVYQLSLQTQLLYRF